MRVTRRHRRRPVSLLVSWLRCLLLGGMLGAMGLIWFHHQVIPLLKVEAETRLQAELLQSVNELVAQEIADGEISYENIITLQTGEDGSVTALQTDLSALNLLRANIVRQVKSSMGSLEPITLRVPLGELLHTTVFATKGVKIPLEVTAADVVTAEFASCFTAEGINQTRHQIILRVTAQLEVLLPGGIQTLSAQTDVPVADTVLVGQVPESFAEFQGTDTAEDAMENYYNFF